MPEPVSATHIIKQVCSTLNCRRGSSCHVLPPTSANEDPRGMEYADKPSVCHTLLWSIRLKGFIYIKFVKSSPCLCPRSETQLFLRKVIIPKRPETQPPALATILCDLSKVPLSSVTKGYSIAKELIKDSMFASR